jgi:hypothetical protein
VDPTPATVLPASSSTTATAEQPISFIEFIIGLQVAGAAANLLLALEEYADGGLSPKTKAQSGELIYELYRWHQHMQGRGDFDAIARRRGVAVLRKDNIALPIAEMAVDEILAILRKVIRDNLN